MKSTGGTGGTPKEREFLFVRDELYWWRNVDTDRYPLGRIVFDEGILRLKLDEMNNQITIKIARKKYILSAESLDVTQEWFCLFKDALDWSLNNNNST